MLHIGAIIQARMSSHRLPAKVLWPVAGKPLLQYLVERARRCSGLCGVVLATSCDPSDDPLADFCTGQNLACHRGPLENVAHRFLGVLDRYAWEAFVRLNGDSPLLDQSLIARALGLFAASEVDLVTNVYPRSFPPGQSVEVIRTAAFRRAVARMTMPDEFEHVTRYFYTRPEEFRIVNFASERPLNHHHLAVDTPDELKRFSDLVARMTRPHWQYGLDDVLRLLEERSIQPVSGGPACGA